MSWTLGALIFLALTVAPVRSGGAEDPLAERLTALTPARERVRARFTEAGLAYPPRAVTLATFKRDRRLEVHARSGSGAWRGVADYPIVGQGAVRGPKLREGDGRTPEGVYRVTHLNPRSRFHVSLLLNYPNAADRARAASEGRTDLGGDIVIHGGSASIGCLALGDDAAEDLFVLAADVGLRNVEVVIAPWDFRAQPPPMPGGEGSTSWIDQLYLELAKRLAVLPALEPVRGSGVHSAAGPAVARRIAVATPVADYRTVKQDIAVTQSAFGKAFRGAATAPRRSEIIAEARRYLLNAIVQRIFPPWIGTRWDYNGTSQVPGIGSIACGYFVTTVLRDTGFQIDRIRLAQLPSEELILGVCDPRDVRRFSDVPAPDFVEAVRRQGAGLYIVGLDNHVGFLVHDGQQVRFVHSTVVGKAEVVDEPALESGPLVFSRYRVVGRVLGDRAVVKWLDSGH